MPCLIVPPCQGRGTGMALWPVSRVVPCRWARQPVCLLVPPLPPTSRRSLGMPTPSRPQPRALEEHRRRSSARSASPSAARSARSSSAAPGRSSGGRSWPWWRPSRPRTSRGTGTAPRRARARSRTRPGSGRWSTWTARCSARRRRRLRQRRPAWGALGRGDGGGAAGDADGRAARGRLPSTVKS